MEPPRKFQTKETSAWIDLKKKLNIIVPDAKILKTMCMLCKVNSKFIVPSVLMQLYVVGDSKIDSFIRENSTLHLDNEKLAKIAHQRKTEAELWKQKYENQVQQVIQVVVALYIVQIKANYELEIRQLSAEVQRLVARVEEFEFDKQRQISEVKTKIDESSNKHLNSLRNSHQNQSELMEQQVRKLREHIEDQNLEIDALQAKLLRVKNDDDEEMKRLLKDNESLRLRINQLEVDR